MAENKRKKMSLTDKRFIMILSAIIITLISMISIYHASFKNGKYACAKFTGIESNIRSSIYYEYTYTVDGKNHTSTISLSYLSLHDLDSLTKIDCVKIKCSVFSNYFSKVVDSRIIK